MTSVRARRRLLAVPLIVLILVAVAGLVRARFTETVAQPPPTAPPAGTALMTPHGPPSAPPPAPQVRTDSVRLAGPVPATGQGTFAYGASRSRVFGTAGQLRRYRVAVERGANESVTTFARLVDATLGDPRSWIGNRTVRLQRVGSTDPADFTIYLATRNTAGRMCSHGGVDIRVANVPHTSCRVTGRVILNLDRWRLSATPYVQARASLRDYRSYLVNHEVGHQLGEGHQACPRPGAPAPVMVQQTLSLRGCLPYAWPRRANRPLSGPRL